MPNTLHHETEVVDDSATLYLSGALCAADAPTLSRACAALPERVRTLRLDLHGVSDMRDDAMTAVRVMFGFWRASRGGSFRLSVASPHLVATYAEGTCADVQGDPVVGPSALGEST